jgi:Spy/CpxP family protein refolding chaperone
MKLQWLVAAIMLAYASFAWSGEHASPYAGQERQEIKALTAEEVRGYLAGDGMAFAKAAELNHYPGPSHVLEMADKLQLTDEQRRKTKAIFDKVKAEAKQLGKQLVEKEHLLDSRFAAGTISDTEVKRIVAEIAAIQGRLRAAHLQAHLAQRSVLKADQIRDYDALREYQGSGTQGQHGGH